MRLNHNLTARVRVMEGILHPLSPGRWHPQDSWWPERNPTSCRGRTTGSRRRKQPTNSWALSKTLLLLSWQTGSKVSPLSCEANLIFSPTINTLLLVRGMLKSWTKLWCILKPGVILLYKSDKAKVKIFFHRFRFSQFACT